jgi:hypothetical protein
MFHICTPVSLSTPLKLNLDVCFQNSSLYLLIQDSSDHKRWNILWFHLKAQFKKDLWSAYHEPHYRKKL